MATLEAARPMQPNTHSLTVVEHMHFDSVQQQSCDLFSFLDCRVTVPQRRDTVAGRKQVLTLSIAQLNRLSGTSIQVHGTVAAGTCDTSAWHRGLRGTVACRGLTASSLPTK